MSEKPPRDRGRSRHYAESLLVARHSYNPVTAAEKQDETNRLTRRAITKALGVPYEQFAQAWYAWAKTQTDTSP
ncbi:MAG: hypothetical protein M1602_03395 [Firmicutes bacterium]|nr:hypothetical protein [Bacillota bacterium]